MGIRSPPMHSGAVGRIMKRFENEDLTTFVGSANRTLVTNMFAGFLCWHYIILWEDSMDVKLDKWNTVYPFPFTWSVFYGVSIWLQGCSCSQDTYLTILLLLTWIFAVVILRRKLMRLEKE